MHVWRFYLKNDEEKGYELYALTNNRDIANEFMTMRDMNMFICIKSKVEKSEWINISTENRLAVLIKTELATQDVKGNGLIGTTEVEVVITGYEHQCCDGDYNTNVLLDAEYWCYDAPPYSIFRGEYQDALREIGYVTDFNFYKNMYDQSYYVDYEKMDTPNEWIDELALFLKAFSYTMKM